MWQRERRKLAFHVKKTPRREASVQIESSSPGVSCCCSGARRSRLDRYVPLSPIIISLSTMRMGISRKNCFDSFILFSPLCMCAHVTITTAVAIKKKVKNWGERWWMSMEMYGTSNERRFFSRRPVAVCAMKILLDERFLFLLLCLCADDNDSTKFSSFWDFNCDASWERLYEIWKRKIKYVKIGRENVRIGVKVWELLSGMRRFLEKLLRFWDDSL